MRSSSNSFTVILWFTGSSVIRTPCPATIVNRPSSVARPLIETIIPSHSAHRLSSKEQSGSPEDEEEGSSMIRSEHGCPAPAPKLASNWITLEASKTLIFML